MPGYTAGWIEQSDEPCPHCFHGYALYLQLHCVDCDRPMCPLCAVSLRSSRAILCSDCASAPAGAA